MPSLSVVHTVPSRRRNEAPAHSSPPNPIEPSIRPGTNHLKPTGTSTSRRPSSAATRSIIDDDTSVLPIADVAGQSARCPNRYSIATARKWLGFISPASGVTMPWRSASASLPIARSKRSRAPISDAIAYGDEQSIRILPSQSSVMNRNVGSTIGFTTVRSRPWRSAIARPVGDARAAQRDRRRCARPARGCASRSTTVGRSST